MGQYEEALRELAGRRRGGGEEEEEEGTKNNALERLVAVSCTSMLHVSRCFIWGVLVQAETIHGPW